MRDELKRLVEDAEARSNAATPGEWVYQRNTLPPTQGVILRAHYVLAVDADHRVVAGGTGDVFFPEDDARFIANARQDVPALCTAVRELDAEQTRMLKTISALVVDWRGIAATSLGVNSEGYRDGLRACARALEKLLPPDPTTP